MMPLKTTTWPNVQRSALACRMVAPKTAALKTLAITVAVLLIASCGSSGYSPPATDNNFQGVKTNGEMQSEPVRKHAEDAAVVLESSLLLPEQGYTGTALGISVDDVEVDAGNGEHAITLSVPQEIGTVTEVEVLDSSGRPLRQLREAQMLRDYENNNVGLKIYLAPKSNMQFKLKLSTEQ